MRKRLFAFFLVTIILSLWMSIYVFADNKQFQGLEKLETTGNNVLIMARRIGRILLTILATYHVIKTGIKSSTKEAFEILIKYALIYGSLYIIPFLMDIIESAFS